MKFVLDVGKLVFLGVLVLGGEEVYIGWGICYVWCLKVGCFFFFGKIIRLRYVLIGGEGILKWFWRFGVWYLFDESLVCCEIFVRCIYMILWRDYVRIYSFFFDRMVYVFYILLFWGVYNVLMFNMLLFVWIDYVVVMDGWF